MQDKLVSIKKSLRKNKKFMATFYVDGKLKKTHFGAEGYDDYTLGAIDKKRDAYRARHKGDRINDPFTAGALSYHLLWGDSRSLIENIEAFKDKFNL
jgi:hypothetical protein